MPEGAKDNFGHSQLLLLQQNHQDSVQLTSCDLQVLGYRELLHHIYAVKVRSQKVPGSFGYQSSTLTIAVASLKVLNIFLLVF